MAISRIRKPSSVRYDKTGKLAEKIDGYTPQQRYFLGFGRAWCSKMRPEYSRMLVTVDPHSPGKFRVDGVVQNMPGAGARREGLANPNRSGLEFWVLVDRSFALLQRNLAKSHRKLL